MLLSSCIPDMLKRCFPLVRRGSTASRRTVREVGDPQLIGPGGHELPMNAIQRSISDIRREGRALLAPPNDATQPVSAHQPLDRAASDWNAFAVQLPPDLARTVHPEVLLPDAMDRAGELAIALHARWQA